MRRIILGAVVVCLLCRSVGAGILCGFPDGSLRQDEPLLREQFVTMLMRAVMPEKSEYRTAFVDVTPRHWAYRAVCFASERKLYSDFQNPHFEPKKQVNAEEFRLVMQAAFPNAEIAVLSEAPTRLEAAEMIGQASGQRN